MSSILDGLKPTIWQWRGKNQWWSQTHTYFHEVHATAEDTEVRKLYAESDIRAAEAELQKRVAELESEITSWQRLHAEMYEEEKRLRAKLEQVASAAVPNVDALAQFIRTIDGRHQIGAGELAERICEWLSATPQPAVAEPCPGQKFVDSQKPLEPEFAKIMHDNLWYLMATEADTRATAAGWMAGTPIFDVKSAPQPAVAEPSFQARVAPWMLECFGAEISSDKMERNHRLFEEATELVQACGMTASEAHQLVDYTFSRPVGVPQQEVGGVMVTLAALCLANDMDMHLCGDIELMRILQPEVVLKIRAKQATKPKHSPLPEAETSATASVAGLHGGRPMSLRECMEAEEKPAPLKVPSVQVLLALQRKASGYHDISITSMEELSEFADLLLAEVQKGSE